MKKMLNLKINGILIILSSTLLFVSCGDDEILIPRPPSYLRMDLPKHAYTSFKDECPYSFEYPSYFSVQITKDELGNNSCHKDINFGALNGVMHFSYIEMEEPLSKYVNYSNDKVGDHKLKATKILDKQIIRPESKVYGTFFELQGDVASPFQFYLTDSTERFASGVIYFNNRPNYDSLKPVLDHLEIDLMHFVNTFEWN